MSMTPQPAKEPEVRMTQDEVLAVLGDMRRALRKARVMVPGETRIEATVAALYEGRAWRRTEDERPADGQLIAYYFEPFGSCYIGTYEEGSDTVGGRAGFTTMTPEVPLWFALPPLPEADK